MIKPIAKQQTMDDGLTPPGTIRDELYLVDELAAYLGYKYDIERVKAAMSVKPRRAREWEQVAHSIGQPMDGGDTDDQTGEA
ncbi:MULTISPECIES: hypothetical protein [Paenibacillus]|uniref:Uncharacterized protein n=1 Tax=Paenibacillus pabuli TaxID=1472 RepID=A0A855Y914_9BACL|nr:MULTISPECIES: hypothetical protein [Paenibacillus]PWW37385.1 hypothetical protein DET56_109272 [Paenibacillus pabuli]PXW05527.1 hypothetical protein DEU73_108271 [Paenibacillus taichungensis]